MTFDEYRHLVLSDQYRYRGCTDLKTFLKLLMFEPGFKCTFWMRTGTWLEGHPWLGTVLSRAVHFLLVRYRYKYGIQLYAGSRIGSGFYIGHFGGIFVAKDAVIGRNCNISQGVTIGKANRGKRKGLPVIGDNVYIAPGAKIFGNVRIGNNVAVGANSVVSRDVPDNAVVVGVPCRVISLEGSEGYINSTDYPEPAYSEADEVLENARLNRTS